MAQFYDAIIIGSGPAGLTAALYLGRAGQKCIVLEKDFVGGYTAKIAHIENYPGYETINGMDLTADHGEAGREVRRDDRLSRGSGGHGAQGRDEARADPRRSVRSRMSSSSPSAWRGKSWRCPAPRNSSARACPTAPPATATSSRAGRSPWSARTTRRPRRRSTLPSSPPR